MAINYEQIAAKYPHDATYMRYVDDYTFFHLIGDVAGKSILDVGCGRGEHAREFKARGAARVVGVDHSVEMLTFAQEAEDDSPLGTEYHELDMFCPKVFDQFDIVTAFSVLSVAPTRGKLLAAARTMAMNLRPGGRFVTVGLNPEQDPDTYSLCEKYGYKVVSPPPVEEGAELLSTMPVGDKELVFQDYYFSLATYESVLRDAGFQQVRWHAPMVSPEGLDEYGMDFWREFIDCRMSIYLECIK